MASYRVTVVEGMDRQRFETHLTTVLNGLSEEPMKQGSLQIHFAATEGEGYAALVTWVDITDELTR